MVATKDATDVSWRNALLVDEHRETDSGVNESTLPTPTVYITMKAHEANVGKATHLVGVVWWFSHFNISFLSTIMSRYSSQSMAVKSRRTGVQPSVL